MRWKDKLLNKIADRLDKYKTPEYDRTLDCSINGEVKGAFMTLDCTTIKEINNKYQKGLIDVMKLLENELDVGESYHHREITFCDKDNVVCLYNSKNNSYYEDVHESFESAQELVYIKCNTNDAYESFKRFVHQSSKYHNFVKYEYEIPKREAFDKIFASKEKFQEQQKEQAEEKSDDKQEENSKTYDNFVQITGKLSSIGKEFIKKDGEKAKFIEIEQEYEYNDKVKTNKISVMLSNNLIDDVSNMAIDDIITIKGKLNTYSDKDNNLKTVIRCNEIMAFDKEKQEKNER